MTSSLSRLPYGSLHSFGRMALAAMTLSAASFALPHGAAAQGAEVAKPTIVLVHGAFADSSSWNGVIARLVADGYPVVAAANPLRGVKFDSSYVASIVDGIKGSVVLVGHSYGGSVISNVTGKANVKAFVFVAAFAPEVGESAAFLSEKYPGGTLGPTLAAPVLLADGNKDLYIKQDQFRTQFAADVPAKDTVLMAAGQRPITEAALGEVSGAPAWKGVPSYFIYGDLDKNIPAAAQEFMAKRAGAKKSVQIKGASHVVMTSNPVAVEKLIVAAAAER